MDGGVDDEEEVNGGLPLLGVSLLRRDTVPSPVSSTVLRVWYQTGNLPYTGNG